MLRAKGRIPALEKQNIEKNRWNSCTQVVKTNANQVNIYQLYMKIIIPLPL